MTININIPNFDGCWIDVFWEDNAQYKAVISNNDIIIYGNKAAFHSFARQMMYFCFNNIPLGSHVHFDDFFCKNRCCGPELIIGLLRNNNLDMTYFDNFTGEISIEIPDKSNGVVWYDDSSMVVKRSNQQVSLQGNKSALYALAKQLLVLCNLSTPQITSSICQYSNQLKGWEGQSVELRYFSR